MRIDLTEGEGTSVHIYLPRAASEAEAAAAAAAPLAAALDADAKVFLVDDDSAVRVVTAAMLREVGYDVIEAGSGGAALELIDGELAIDLVIIDVAMPGARGAELARRVRLKRPRLPILFVTGFAERAVLEGVSDMQIIGKPFISSELANKVRLALAGQASALSI